MNLDNMFGNITGKNGIMSKLSGTFGGSRGGGLFGFSRNGSGCSRCNSISISQDAAYNMILSGNCNILDVRQPEEYAVKRIKGAINVPLGKIMGELELYISDKERCIIVYCASGSRTRTAVQQLYQLGYKNVYVWEGAGINNFKYNDIIESGM